MFPSSYVSARSFFVQHGKKSTITFWTSMQPTNPSDEVIYFLEILFCWSMSRKIVNVALALVYPPHSKPSNTIKGDICWNWNKFADENKEKINSAKLS